MSAARTLLGGIVDYAGLFPPASLSMSDAVANFAAYAASEDAWMLGRFVVPVGRLDEFAAAGALHAASGAARWRMSALLGDTVAEDVAHVHAFVRAHHAWASVDTLEGKATTGADVDRLAAAAVPAFDLYIEIPIVGDPAPLIAQIGRRGANAKVRTGGITPAAIPDAGQLVRFMDACITANVPFKATAGLHHPVRGDFALTYAADAPHAFTYGYLNVFLAAALLRAGGSVQEASTLLTETDAGEISLVGDAVQWRDFRFTAAQLSAMRGAATSFGSCSFREPVDDLVSLGLT